MLAKHPDPTVAHVLETWAPRMIVQGIDYNDLITTAARISVWNDWCREWCATAAEHERFALQNEAEGNVESATESYLLAAMAYHFGCNNSPDDLDQYVPAARKRVEASDPKQWVLLEGGNHVCNNMPFRYRPLVGDFLAKHLGAKSV
jgi:hypothetical protein